jgi:hypothetical protein
MIELNKFERYLKEQGWIKFENTQVYFKKFTELRTHWQIYIYNQKEMDYNNEILEKGQVSEEYVFKSLRLYSDHIIWAEDSIPYYMLCTWAASSYFATTEEDVIKFRYYKEQYERLTGRKWNAGFVKRPE